ncbi:MAG: hypothetical protein QG672_2023, partial [Pseudomonadota bacterium]|nr:hypothetical protein [Pseudomonadota bacterium]
KAARAKAAADFSAGPVPSEPTPVAAAVAEAVRAPELSPDVVDAAMVNNLRTFDDFLTVWHGSPYKFDAFDAAHIGKGEGAQAYGHGLYLTATSDVAKSYAAETAFKYGQKDIAEMMYSQKLGDASAAAKSLRKEMDSMRWERYPPGERAQYDAALAKLDAWAKEKPQFGQLYKVALPNSVIAKMLDWDKPLSQQPEVLKALETHPTMGKESLGWRGAPPGMWERAMSSPSRTGEWLYSELGVSGVEQTAAAKQAGITGIRYLDGGSRASGEGTYNYVIFPGEEGKLRILEVNGKPSAAPESAAPAPPKTAAEAGDPIAKLNEPADAKPKPAADPIMSTVATRVADLESTAPDMVVRIADDGKHVTLADDLAEVRRMVAEGTDDSLGTLDADLMRVAVECALSTGG